MAGSSGSRNNCSAAADGVVDIIVAAHSSSNSSNDNDDDDDANGRPDADENRRTAMVVMVPVGRVFSSLCFVSFIVRRR